MFDHLLESSLQDDSNKWSNIGFGEGIIQLESIEVYFTHLIWSSATGTWSTMVVYGYFTMLYYVDHVLILILMVTTPLPKLFKDNILP